LRQEVYERIKQEIITCSLAPGQPLNESELAQRLAVSKTPVREALTQLQHDSLVELIPRKGYLVTNLTLKDVQEIFESRLILERAVTTLAAERITDAEIASLERYLELPEPDDANAVYRYIQANKEFHLEIAAASRNSRLVRYLAHVLDDAQRLQYMDLNRAEEARGAWHRDHGRILDALHKHDKAAAAAAVEDALAEARARLLSP
jgi:DNA-binding GntR family transcriptional regulator